MRATTSTEQHHMAARTRQGAVATASLPGALNKFSPGVFRRRRNAARQPRRWNPLSGYSQGFIFQRGDTARFVPRRWVFIVGWSWAIKYCLKSLTMVTSFQTLLRRGNGPSATALRQTSPHFGQYGSTAVSNHVVRETPRIGLAVIPERPSEPPHSRPNSVR